MISLFSSFDSLDQISPEALASWLKPVPQIVQLENYLANKILYPDTLPLTEYDMQIDLGILREALKMSKVLSFPKTNALFGDSPFLNVTLRKILIPKEFLSFVPDLKSLTQVFIDAFLLNRRKEDFFQDMWTIVVTSDVDEVVGSILLPQFESKEGKMNLKLLGRDYEIRPGSLMILPCSTKRCEIAYKLLRGKVLGLASSAVEVYGGKLGLVIDGRGI